jgi:hypothetical protein
MRNSVITAFELRTDQDKQEYELACRLLQGIAERSIDPEAWPFIRDGAPVVIYRNLEVLA